MFNHGWRRWHGKDKYSLIPQGGNMKPGTKGSIFTTEFTEDTEVKTESANCSGDSHNNSLTQCIIFISFMNFMVKKAALCVLCDLYG